MLCEKPERSSTFGAMIKRDPFEQTISFSDSKSAMALGGTLASPSTAYLYDWNMLPIGQLSSLSSGNLIPTRTPAANTGWAT